MDYKRTRELAMAAVRLAFPLHSFHITRAKVQAHGVIVGPNDYEATVNDGSSWCSFIVSITLSPGTRIAQTTLQIADEGRHSEKWYLSNRDWWVHLKDGELTEEALRPPIVKRTKKPRADRTLDRLHLLIPRRYREVILGDLHEDVEAMRKDGYAEKTLCRYIYLQVFYVVLERLKPWNWLKGGAFLWLVHKIIG